MVSGGQDDMRASRPTANVLDEDPDLAADLAAAGLEEARCSAVVPVVSVARGGWSAPKQIAIGGGGLGWLVLDGVLVRNVSMGDRTAMELFGTGDLVRPFDEPEPQDPMPAKVGWWALSPTRLAVLNAGFTSRMCLYPEVIDALSGRLEQRSSELAVRFAIMQQSHLAERLRLLLWHIADRFGRVHPEGVVLPLPLTHELLAQLVGARRASVSRALKGLARAGTLSRRTDGGWLLTRPAATSDGP